MTSLPTVTGQTEEHLATWSSQQMDILRNTVCKGASDHQLMFFAQVCRAKKLDPFGGQIFLIIRNTKDGPQMAIQTGIDGLRAQAARTGDYAGNDEPVFEYGSDDKPTKASVTVHRMIQGQRVAFTAAARWAEFYPGDAQGFMWRGKPHVMLGKVAEAQALRKAFPNECSGLYEAAELQANHMQDLPKAHGGAQALNARFKPGSPMICATREQIMAMEKAFDGIGLTAEIIVGDYLDKPLDENLTLEDLDKLRAIYEEKKASK